MNTPEEITTPADDVAAQGDPPDIAGRLNLVETQIAQLNQSINETKAESTAALTIATRAGNLVAQLDDQQKSAPAASGNFNAPSDAQECLRVAREFLEKSRDPSYPATRLLQSAVESLIACLEAAFAPAEIKESDDVDQDVPAAP